LMMKLDILAKLMTKFSFVKLVIETIQSSASLIRVLI
jgi:hypothetical protein